MKRTGPSNQELRNLIENLKQLSFKEDVKIWGRIADDLERPTRIRREVNIFNIDKNAKDNETVIVPGKVLSSGDLTRKVTIAAYKFSKSALDKINKTGKAMTIAELMKQNPKGSKVRILG